MAAIWADVFGRERVGIHERFGDLGGHSLLAIQIIARARDAFRSELPLRAIFEAPTVAGLARARRGAARRGRARRSRRPSAPCPATARSPLSFAQERLWFLDQLEPESSAVQRRLGLAARGRARRGRPRAGPAARSCSGTRCCAPPSPPRAGSRCRWSTPTPSSRCRRRGLRARGRGGGAQEAPRRRQRRRSISRAARCSAPGCCGSEPKSTCCSSRSTTSSPTAGRPGHPRPRGGGALRRVPAGPALAAAASSPSSTPTTPCGSAAGSPARCSRRQLALLEDAARRRPLHARSALGPPSPARDDLPRRPARLRLARRRCAGPWPSSRGAGASRSS